MMNTLLREMVTTATQAYLYISVTPLLGKKDGFLQREAIRGQI
ncbi:MAG: hypothetical protein ACI9Q9_001100 [Flavobacterium sp.]|jgi:hypothetical protein